MYLSSPKAPPKWRRYSFTLVTNLGRIGPRSVSPRKAAVLVATPSIGRGPRSISSMNTPGARYSGMATSVQKRGKRSIGRLVEQRLDVGGAILELRVRLLLQLGGG